MFSSHAQSSSQYAQALDYHPTRSPPSPASPLPSGECRFILLHPSIQNQRCSCQGFRLNRAIPGSSCECGHLACYHIPSTPSHDNINLVSFTQHIALMEKVRKLEEDLAEAHSAVEDTQKALEDVQKGRAEDSIGIRENMRHLWRAMERKLVGMDDKIEAAVDMACETRDDVRVAKTRIESVEDSTMALEAQLDAIHDEGSDTSHDSKRRRMRKSSLPFIDVRSPNKHDSNTKSSKMTNSPHLTPSPSRKSRSLSPPSRSLSHLYPASDFASPAIKAFAPPFSKSSTISRETAPNSPYDSFDTPSPVDFLASIANMPMKRQIREVDNGTVEALDSAGANAKSGGPLNVTSVGKKRKRVGVGVGVGVAGAGEGSGAREIGVVKETLLSMPVGELSYGNGNEG